MNPSVEEALELAMKKLGPSAVVEQRIQMSAKHAGVIWSVGTTGNDSHAWACMGEGTTFAEALATATARPKVRRR